MAYVITAPNAVMGPADWYIGAYQATEPDPSTVNSTPAASAWTPLGGTDSGTTINFAQTIAQLMMDQTAYVVGSQVSKIEATAATNLAEVTQQNLMYALNGGTIATGSGAGVSYSTYDPVADSAVFRPTYKALLVHGWAPSAADGTTKRRMFIMRRVLSISTAVGIPYAKDKQTVYPVTFGMHFVSQAVKPWRIIDEL
jgi:hypothetical protein